MGDLPNTYGYSELIHPDKFAIKTADLHMGHIGDAADALEAMGTALVDNVTSAHGSSRRRSRGIRSGSRTGGRHRGARRPQPGSIRQTPTSAG